MQLRRLISVPRLARNVLASLIDRRALLGSGASLPIRAGDTEIGRIGEVIWRRRQVEIRGRIKARSAGLGFEHRAPVPLGPHFDMRLDRPEDSAALTLSFHTDANEQVLRFDAPGRLREGFARARALPGALCDVMAEGPRVLAFLRTGDQAVAASLRRRFGLTPEDDAAFPVPPGLLSPVHSLPRHVQPASVIVPVYNATDDTARLLERLSIDQTGQHRIILVDDGSDDPLVGPMLKAFCAADPRTRTLIAFPENRGFVAAVNAGITATQGHGHVVILNTDTLPPRNWLPRLLAPLDTDASIATVTPFSNNAELLSVPAAGVQTEVEAPLLDRLDQTARCIAREFQLVDIPTGIGFCMALSRRFLELVGPFDSEFGHGYGEEVDWCQKARRAGGRHVALTNLVVGHRGGASFGSRKPARIRAASNIIAARYPDYDEEVQRWIRAAPAGPQRLAVSLAWLAAASSGAVTVFVGHSLGGGAEAGLAGELAALLDAGAPGAVVLRTGGHRAWRVELHGRGFTQSGEVAEAEMVHKLLAPVPDRHVVYSCGVGAEDPAAVPKMLLDLAIPTARLDLRLHDFFVVSPSWNLLGRSGAYTGVPGRDTSDPSHSVPRAPGRAPMRHRDWRSLWERVIERSTEITGFAASGIDILCEAYPLAAGKTRLQPHPLTNLPGRIMAGGQTIGVLGGINRAKGGEVLCRLARHSGCRRIVVIGELDGEFRLPRPHLVHGRYDRKQIVALARSYGIGLWLIPSICPETFSFAMHEALATGLPVLAFDRGAQGDAARSAPNGHLLDDPEDTAALIRRIETIFRD